MNVSATYFSTVFKKETGKTFINYLTEYRMQQAVDMLLTQNEKTYMIAEKVGYADPNYFSYAYHLPNIKISIRSSIEKDLKYLPEPNFIF